MKLAVCWKWTALDAGAGAQDERWSGVSHADEAALEIALRLATATSGTVTVVVVGPPAADAALRAARAVGGTDLVRVDVGAPPDSRLTARLLADAVRGHDVVLCGDHSVDRGTGSVPAFLAADLRAAQALGLLEVDTGTPGPIRAVRRLDGGRREVLAVTAPAVLSVEGAAARLRRAGLPATLAAQDAPIRVTAGPHIEPDTTIVRPYRPRPRGLPGPEGPALERVRELLDVGGEPSAHAEIVTLEPAAAARRLVEQLREWGYLS